MECVVHLQGRCQGAWLFFHDSVIVQELELCRVFFVRVKSPGSDAGSLCVLEIPSGSGVKFYSIPQFHFNGNLSEWKGGGDC